MINHSEWRENRTTSLQDYTIVKYTSMTFDQTRSLFSHIINFNHSTLPDDDVILFLLVSPITPDPEDTENVIYFGLESDWAEDITADLPYGQLNIHRVSYDTHSPIHNFLLESEWIVEYEMD